MKITIALPAQSITASTNLISVSATQLEMAKKRLVKLTVDLKEAKTSHKSKPSERTKKKILNTERNISDTKRRIISLKGREKRMAEVRKDKEKQKASGMSPAAYKKVQREKQRKQNLLLHKHHEFADNLHPEDREDFWKLKKSDRNRMVKHREKNNTRYKDAYFDMHPDNRKT